LDFSA